MTASLLFAQQKGMVIIKGTLNGDLKGYNRMYMYTRTSNDSAEIRNGQYTFRFPFTAPAMKMLYPQYIKESHMMYQPFGILVSEPGVYYVVSDIAKGMPASELKGPEAMVLYHRFEEDERKAYGQVNAATAARFGEKWWQLDEKDSAYASLEQARDSLEAVYILPLIRKLVKEHPDSYASAYVLLGSGRQTGTTGDKEALYNQLSARMKKSDAGEKFRDYIQGLKSSVIGHEVADFVLPDPSGKNIDFKSLKGKYVLIDFWASWCVPCRRSFPRMREVYKKYKDDGFEIYNVSIDEDKEAWLKAVKEESNPWPQSLDTKSISQKGFAVTSIPASFLVDPQGKILLKEVGFDPDGGSAIEKKLAEIFASGKNGQTRSVPMVPLN
jgi:thiol-disulfide isomerase/thioredoxin